MASAGIMKKAKQKPRSIRAAIKQTRVLNDMAVSCIAIWTTLTLHEEPSPRTGSVSKSISKCNKLCVIIAFLCPFARC